MEVRAFVTTRLQTMCLPDAACTVWFTFVATIIVILAASVRKFHQIGWLTYAGFLSIYIAVFIVV